MGLAVLGKGGFYGWISLAAAALVYFLISGAIAMSLGVFMPSICKDFGWSRGAVSGAATMFLMVLSLVGPLAGWFIGRFGPRLAIIIGNASCVLGLVYLACHSKVWELYFVYGVLFGLGSGMGGFLAATTIASNWFTRKAPLAVGVIMAAGGIGGMVMIPIIMALINSIGWRSTYMALGGIVLLFGVIVPGLSIKNKPEDLGQIPDGSSLSEIGKVNSGPETKQHTIPVDFTVKEAMGTSTLWLLIVLIAVVLFLFTLVTAHQVAFLIDLGISPGVAASTLGLFSGVSTVGTIAMGLLAVKLSLKKLNIIAATLMLLSMILALMTSLIPRSLSTAIVYTTIFGLGFGGTFVAGISFLPTYFGRTNYSKIMGITMVFTAIGTTGASVGGVIFDATKSYTVPFTVAVIVGAIGLMCALLIRPPTIHPSLKEKVTQVEI